MIKKRTFKHYKTRKKGGQHYWIGRKNYASTFIKGHHKIKIGSKPKSPLTETDIETEVNKIPNKEISKIKRINLADWEDYKHKKGQIKIPPTEPGFVHPKRGKDIYLINQPNSDLKEVLHHELSHGLTNKEYKKLVKAGKKYIDALPLSSEEKKRRLNKFKLDFSEYLRKKKQREVFGDG